jgi:uncharacterized protein DUF3226
MGNYFCNVNDWKLRGNRNPSIIFLCEGESETEFVDKWLTNRDEDSNNIWIYCFRGLSKIREKISILIKEPNFTNVNTVCIFLDAEDNYEARKDSVRSMLRRLGFPHSNINSIPWVEEREGKKSCVFISPNMEENGRIENIVIEEISGSTEIYNCIETYRDCLSNNGILDFDEKKFVNTYIVSHQVGIGLGAAFKAGIFDVNNRVYDQLNQILELAVNNE